MSQAVVLSGSLLAFLSRGCCLLGEHRRQLGQSPALTWKAPDAPGQRARAGSWTDGKLRCDLGAAPVLWWNSGWREVVVEAIRKTSVHVNSVSSTSSTVLGEKVAGCVSHQL